MLIYSQNGSVKYHKEAVQIMANESGECSVTFTDYILCRRRSDAPQILALLYVVEQMFFCQTEVLVFQTVEHIKQLASKSLYIMNTTHSSSLWFSFVRSSVACLTCTRRPVRIVFFKGAPDNVHWAVEDTHTPLPPFCSAHVTTPLLCEVQAVANVGHHAVAFQHLNVPQLTPTSKSSP